MCYLSFVLIRYFQIHLALLKNLVTNECLSDVGTRFLLNKSAPQRLQYSCHEWVFPPQSLQNINIPPPFCRIQVYLFPALNIILNFNNPKRSDDAILRNLKLWHL